MVINFGLSRSQIKKGNEVFGLQLFHPQGQRGFFFGGVGKAVLLVVETNCFSSHILVRVKFEVTGFGSVKRRQLILSEGKLEIYF